MAIGRLQDDAALSPVVCKKITSDKRYFLDFTTYLLATHGLAHIVEASQSGQSNQYKPGDSAMFSCKQSPAQWFWHPEPSIQNLSNNITPTELHLERYVCDIPETDAELNLGSTTTLLYNFGQALATNYYERTAPHIKDIYGNNPDSWPNVWNFARVVRNAMSHGGKIHINNHNAQRVSWKNLNYTSLDNGHMILHTDLWPGDIFDLIEEMDCHLPYISITPQPPNSNSI